VGIQTILYYPRSIATLMERDVILYSCAGLLQLRFTLAVGIVVAVIA
jgi:hypothetical protein